jgi:hypothetical protein
MRLVAESRAAVRLSVLLALALVAGGCSHWPWHHRPPPGPQPVHELTISGAGADTFPQYWKRNTLLVDLSSASGSGSITLKPTAAGWPVRLALRVTPGAFGVLDVRGAQRVSLPMASAGPPVDLELSPGVYTAATSAVTVQWGPAAPL